VTPTAPPPATTPRPGPLARVRLLHPCRFYAYGWGLLLVVALAIAAVTSGEWQYSASGVLALLLMVPGIEAAARSTVGPADVYRAYVKARQ
jgi:hypothetical protein